LTVIYFLNAHTGLVAGVDHALFRTVDGGATWARVLAADPVGEDFWGLYQTGPEQVWCCGRGRLLRSVDAGATWTEAQRPVGMFYHYGACAAVEGLLFMIQPATCGTTVYQTRDGASWAKLPAGMPRNDYTTLFALDPTNLWVAGDYGRLARTRDGGASWEKLELTNNTSLAELQFVNSQTGWARSLYSGVLVTTDGGVGWIAQEAGSYASADDLQVVDSSNGFLLVAVDTTHSRLLRTRDGGVSWAEAAAFSHHLQSVHMLNDARSWLAGAKGFVIELTMQP
jgi:photosystem II stability/assembly factor-like uncharacterized protein